LLIGNKSFSTLLALGIMRSVSAKLRQAVKREEHERQGDRVRWRALLSALLAMSLTLLAAGGALAQATNAHGGAAAIPQESLADQSPTVQPFSPQHHDGADHAGGTEKVHSDALAHRRYRFASGST
jgi:hypothetical protein